MRILYVTQIIPYPPHGGVLQRGFNLLRELSRSNSIHLLAFHHLDELPYGPAYDASRSELAKFCETVEYFPLWAKKSKAHKFLCLLAASIYRKPYSVLAHHNRKLALRVRELCSLSNDSRPDLVHLDTIALAPLLSECGGVPAVLTHHNVESQLMNRRVAFQRGFLKRRFLEAQALRLKRYELSQCPRFPLNIAVSNADADSLQRMCPGIRTSVIPNGTDTNYFRPRSGEESLAVIYTGGMQMFANRDAVEWFLDQIWPLLKAALPTLRFFAVGQHPTIRVLEAAARDPTIEVPGFVSDIRPWVAKSAVYIVPLRVGGGTRLKMVDAMAQGKAIVATTVGAEGIQGESGVHFILADSPADFAAATIRLLNDPQARHKLETAARAQAEAAYAWPLIAAKLAADYARVIAEAAP